MRTAFTYDRTPHFVHFAYRFTGKERDVESGLDYFDARYYGSSMGRFMSPDPVFASPERVADPQQWSKRVVMAVPIKGVTTMYPHNFMWIHTL